MGLIFKVPHPKGLEPTIFPMVSCVSSQNPGELLNRSNHSNDSLIFNFPIYLVHQGYSYLIYWQLGGCFQIFRELEDQGITITEHERIRQPEKIHHFKTENDRKLQASFFMRHVTCFLGGVKGVCWGQNGETTTHRKNRLKCEESIFSGFSILVISSID